MRKFILCIAAMLAVSAASFAQTTALEDVIASRRSIRKYTDQKVEREVIDRIVNNGLLAPSGMNRQSYELRIVDDPELLEAISQAAKPGKKSIFLGAPVVIFIAYESSLYDLAQVDCGLLAQNIMLSAKDLGLGTCCMGMPIRQMKDSKECEQYIKKLGFSRNYELLIAVVLGYPDESPAARPRKSNMVKYIDK